MAAITDIQRSRLEISAILRETKLEDVGCLLVLQIESGFSLIFFFISKVIRGFTIEEAAN